MVSYTKIGFEKYAPSPEISTKMCQILLVWLGRPILDTFGHILDDISGLGAYFSKPIFALKPWVHMNPKIVRIYFGPSKGLLK